MRNLPARFSCLGPLFTTSGLPRTPSRCPKVSFPQADGAVLEDEAGGQIVVTSESDVLASWLWRFLEEED